MTRPEDRVGHLMQTDVVTFESDAQVSAAVREMVSRDIGSVVVTSHGEPMGIFTERDLLRNIVEDPQLLERNVGELMTSPPITTTPDAETVEAFKLMTSRGIRRLPVVEAGRLVGIITDRDLMAWVTDVANE